MKKSKNKKNSLSQEQSAAITEEIPVADNTLLAPENAPEDKKNPEASPPKKESEDISEKKPEESNDMEQAASSQEKMSDEEAYQTLGPQSLLSHLIQLLLAPIPMISMTFTFLWIGLGGTVFSVGLVAGSGALVLALFAFWAFGGCTNVNRRRFARAYFLSLGIFLVAALFFGLLASAYGANLSPVLRKIMNAISSLHS